MRYFFSAGTIALAGLLSVVGVSFASTTGKMSDNSLVVIYQTPDTKAKVVESVSPAERLVPIFRQKEWLKVGNPSDGKVGWVNKKQYRHAVKAYYQPTYQAVYVHKEQGKDGKPAVSVVAYKNGNKISDKEAKQLYARFQQQQNREWRSTRYINRQMNQMFFNQARWMEDMHTRW